MQVVGEIMKHYQGKAMPHLVCAIDKPKPEKKKSKKKKSASAEK